MSTRIATLLSLSLPKLRSIGRFRAVRRERQHLRKLDDHLLRDIGLTADQALHEAGKPVWDVPEGWLRK